MKWREPWRESMKAQPPFNPFNKSIVQTFLIWWAAFVVLYLVLFAAGRAAVGLVDFLGIAILIAGVTAMLLYSIRWLSPRKIASGPRGIVIEKGDELALLPWAAIHSFSFSGKTSPATLHITLGSGQVFSLTLRYDSDRAEIDREIRAKMLQVQQRGDTA